MKKICCPFTSWIMAQAQGLGRRYIKAFFKGFFVAVPVTVTFLDRVACVARVEGASMQPSLNPGERQVSDVVLLNHWSIRNYEVQRGDIVSLVMASCTNQRWSLLDTSCKRARWLSVKYPGFISSFHVPIKHHL
ncbi:mitochondrial inner membrane protease subunit 2 isoform X6 [Caretta caretta]|uniref:mitochondrial inner membrane protease subunit 2 isoform X6 n=1 Tax=Caretta caretta TaxID=8467 RepID=UPI0020964F6F|nr:mitochondrial inner membrane protease subunit 2 isoform X5 [Caretta caretta]XP_048692032.1 mitochondrial inner membrane protease subunit 2 isoform X5 [Caretta caretta]